jgi:putative ABC transport system permease protein
MNLINRGIRNAFRNGIRTFSIVIILGLSLALALSMLLARQAVNQKIDNVKSSVGNTITISPAGARGFDGGGNPLTTSQLASVSSLPHVVSVQESLNDRLSSTQTNLVSAVDLGSLGQRFAQRFGSSDSSGSPSTTNFTPPVPIIGTNNPTDLNNTQGGGTFNLKSGEVFSATSSDNVALIGTTLATKNNLAVGSTFTAYNTAIKVVGIFDSGNTFSNNQVIMPLATVQTLSAQPGNITSAIVTADSVSNIDSLTSAVKSKLGTAADVTSSKDQATNAIAPLENIRSISLYSLIGATIAGAVIIFLVMLMIVRERRREIGVLKAIGASNLRVIGQFMVEAVTLTVLAAVVGILIGMVAADPITKTLVNNSTNTTTSQTAAVGGPGGGGFGMRNGTAAGGPSFVGGGRGLGRVSSNITNIHAVVSFSIVLYGIAAALLIALVGSGIASWTIAKIRPAEVMRTE